MIWRVSADNRNLLDAAVPAPIHDASDEVREVWMVPRECNSMGAFEDKLGKDV